jgi:hypothetical protein
MGNNLYSLIQTHISDLLSFGEKFYFLVECMRAQLFNICHRVGVRVASHSYYTAWG